MREPVTPESEVAAFEAFKRAINEDKQSKGIGTFASRHEILGVLTEEFHELMQAVENNHMGEFEEELLDIVVAAFWGVASLKNKTLEW